MTYSVPQGSVLWPKNYILYTKPVGAICKKHGLSFHFYADASQLYMTFKPKILNSRHKTLQNIESCLIDIVQWMKTNLLKLNADKTEVILFMPKRNNNVIDDIRITVGDSSNQTHIIC